MGTYRNQGTMEALRNVYSKGGVKGFWAGWQPKMVESFLKGGILLFSKEAIIRSTSSVGMSEVTSGLIGGFGGGVAQVTVMGPCTFLVTAAVTGDKSVSLLSRVKLTWQTQGIGGFYRGGTALILRQGKFDCSPYAWSNFSLGLQEATGLHDKVSLISCVIFSSSSMYRMESRPRM